MIGTLSGEIGQLPTTKIVGFPAGAIMKKLCPLSDSKKRCHVDCEWLDVEKDKCSVLVYQTEMLNFIKIFQDYLHRDLLIKGSKVEPN